MACGDDECSSGQASTTPTGGPDWSGYQYRDKASAYLFEDAYDHVNHVGPEKMIAFELIEEETQ